MRKGWRPAVSWAGLCVLVLAACAHRVPLSEQTLAALPPRVELGDTPFFPQARYQCGPAALATMLNGRGVTITPEELVPQVYLPARAGSLQAELVAAVRRRGLLAVEIEPELDALLAEVAAGNPVLVLQNLGLAWLPRWHYAVAIGYDLEAGELVLRSGTEPRRITPFGVFMNTWNHAARWGIVVLAPDRLPAGGSPARFLEAASGLEAVGQPEAARSAYRAALTRWHAHPVAWLGVGNTEYALAQYAAAEEAFRHALQLRPDMAVAWNNLAYSLAARRCVRLARESAQCAAQLAPGDESARDTRKDMAALAVPRIEDCQPLPACPLR